jgi:hypothetical protein
VDLNGTRKPLISPWYRRALVAVSIAVVLVALLAGASFRQAAIKACQGTNEAKAAVLDLTDTLAANAARHIPNATPDQLARQAASQRSYVEFRKVAAKSLSPDDCETLVPWGT